MLYLKLVPVIFIILIVAYLAGLSFSTRQHRLVPADERHLSPCPDKPNCVFSQSNQDIHAIQAFSLLENNSSLSWEKLIVAIQQSGGEIVFKDGRYCHAVFTSSLFRFKDDLEAEINETQIEIRSASRAGTSDMGQNRKRVENIRRLYLK
jgi:uncharacterized protein (DUF1499 family)